MLNETNNINARYTAGYGYDITERYHVIIDYN